MPKEINNNMGYYAMYLRKSRKDMEAEQHGEGETLIRHEKRLSELAKLLNIKVSKIYREIVSGESIASRPVMQELLHDVENGLWNGILVVEVERLARGDTMDQGLVSQTFKYSNTKIITPMKTYDPNNEYDEEYFEFGLFMSRREYKTINRRLRSGMLSAINEGKYLASTPPYGYTKIKLKGQKGHSLQIDEKKAEIVRFIFNSYINGEGVSTICKTLDKMGVSTPKEKIQWERSVVRKILHNPVYIGKIRWEDKRTVKKMINGEITRAKNPNSNIILVDGLHEAIISEDIFIKANDMLSSHTKPRQSYTKQLTNPLASIAKCELCGHTMIKATRHKRKGYMFKCNYCNNCSSIFSTVEDKLIESLKLLLHDYKLKETVQDNSDIELMIKLNNDAITNKRLELETTYKQKNNLYDLLEQKIYSKDVFMERTELLNNKIEALKNDLLQLENEQDKLNSRKNNRTILIPQIENVIDTYYKTDNAQLKNNLLKSVLYKFTYKKVNPKSPDDFTLTLYPKIF